MKKSYLPVILILCFVLFGCSSTSNLKTAEEIIPVIPEYYYNWQYKGFGAELPDWLYAALTGDTKTVAAAFSKEKVELGVFEAGDLDSAENKAESFEKSFPGVAVLARFWVSTLTDIESYLSEDEKFYSIRILSIEE